MKFRRLALHLTLLSFLLFTTAVIAIAIDYFFWVDYVHRLESRQRPKTDALASLPNVTSETLRRLGRIITDKNSSFVNFNPQKAPGVIRIGAFGDSFTYGDEVDERSDYPAQLQRLIKESGITNVEVLNFGSPWFGFGQTHIVWDEVGRAFGLDYILLGPTSFFADRDTRFNHTNGVSPYYLHSRYIVEGDKVRLIDLPGATYEERFNTYYGFIPNYRSLLYDRGDPAFIAALLPEDTYVGNPFYYDKRPADVEAVDIQRRLLQNMKQSGTPILAGVYSNYSGIKNAAGDLNDTNFCITEFDNLHSFPYSMQWGHNSPTGNGLLARQYLATLLGQPVDDPVVRTRELDPSSSPPAIEGELSSFEAIHVRLNGVDAGIFTPLFPLWTRQKSSSFLRDDNVKSLLALRKSDSSLLDGIVIASRSEISPDSPLRLILSSGATAKTAELGRLHSLAAGANLGEGVLPGLTVEEGHLGDNRALVSAEGLASVFQDIPQDASLQVVIGDRLILRGSNAKNPATFEMEPADGEMLTVRSVANEDFASTHGTEAGSVNFVLERGTRAYTVPVAQWSIEHRQRKPTAECSALAPLSKVKVPLVTAKPIAITITASGDEYDGKPQMRVMLNGVSIGEVEVTAARKSGEWQTFTFEASVGTFPAVVEISLTNDKFDETTNGDRNLYINSVQVGSQKLPLKEGIISGYQPAGPVQEPREIYNGSLRLVMTSPSG